MRGCGGGIIGGAMSGVGGGDRSDSSVLFLERKQSSTYLPMDAFFRRYLFFLAPRSREFSACVQLYPQCLYSLGGLRVRALLLCTVTVWETHGFWLQHSYSILSIYISCVSYERLSNVYQWSDSDSPPPADMFPNYSSCDLKVLAWLIRKPVSRN